MVAFPEAAIESLNQLETKLTGLQYWSGIFHDAEAITKASVSRSGLFASKRAEQITEIDMKPSPLTLTS